MRTSKNLLWTALGALLAVALIASGARADTDDAAVILDKQVTCKIKGNKEIETEHYRKIEILNRDGASHAIEIILESSLLELKDFSGKLYDSEGNLVEEVDKDDGETVCGYGSYEVYSDYCYTIFGFSRDIYPFTVEYRYKLKQKTLFQWQDWRPQEYIPVKHAKYTLITDDDFIFQYKSSDLIPPPEIIESGGDKIYAWEMNDMPELEEGDYAGIIEFGGIAIQFAPPEYKLGKYKFDGSSWNSLSQGSYIMIHECLDISDEQKDIMDRIVAESESELEICRKLHRKMSALSRYVAIHVNIGGWQPHKSKDTFERGYGDCKDLSTLYVSMLRYAGVDAKYALLSTRNAGITDPDFPSLARFNHAVLFAVADGDTIWIDPTRNDCDIGELPWVDENTYALVIDLTMGYLVRTDSSKAEQNLISRKVELWPQENRSVIISMEYRLAGNPRDHFNAFISSYSETSRADILRNHMYKLSDKFLLDSLDFPKGGIDQPVQELRLWGKVRSALHKIGQDQIMDLTFLDYESIKKTYIDPETYKQPFELLFPKSFVDTVIIHLPDSKAAVNLPDSADIKDDIGAYRICCQADDSLVVITREVSNYQYRIMPDGFLDYWAHRDAVRELGECFIKLGDK